jgi:ADP-ribose pyrophosphatase YjhB (NUDIX family)
MLLVSVGRAQCEKASGTNNRVDTLNPPMQTVVCVGALVMRGKEILLVRQAPGHSLAGQWTIPWGRLESGESPSVAAIRETLEEAGIAASLEGLVGVQELPSPWNGWVALIYLCRYESGEPRADARETDAAAFMSLATFNALDEPVEPWSEWLVRRAFAGRIAAGERDPTNPFAAAPGFF